MRLRHLLGNDFQETPSMQDLLEVSDNINKKFMLSDLGDEMTRESVSRQEMIEVSKNISLYYAPKIMPSKQGLTILAVDPQHLYTYWNIDGQSFNPLAQSLLDNDVLLRVYAHSELPNQPEKKLLVEKTIHDFISQQFIHLPVPAQQQDYSASVEVLNDKKQSNVLLESNHILTQQISTSHISPDQSSVLTRLKDQQGVETFVKKHYASHNHSGQN